MRQAFRSVAIARYVYASDAMQVLVWAPKSLFKHAVDRNRLRRLMREAYRLNKDRLAGLPQQYQVAFNYIDKEVQPYTVVERAMRKALKRLAEATPVADQ